MMVVIDIIAIFYVTAGIVAGGMFIYHNSAARAH